MTVLPEPCGADDSPATTIDPLDDTLGALIVRQAVALRKSLPLQVNGDRPSVMRYCLWTMGLTFN